MSDVARVNKLWAYVGVGVNFGIGDWSQFNKWTRIGDESESAGSAGVTQIRMGHALRSEGSEKEREGKEWCGVEKKKV